MIMAILTIMFRVTILFELVLNPHVPVCQLLRVPVQSTGTGISITMFTCNRFIT